MKFYKPFKATHVVRYVKEMGDGYYDGFPAGTVLQQLESDLYRDANNVCAFVNEYLVDELK